MAGVGELGHLSLIVGRALRYHRIVVLSAKKTNAISKFLLVCYICNIFINAKETQADENSAVVTYFND